MRTAEEIFKEDNRRRSLAYYYEHQEYCQARQRAYYQRNKKRIAEQRKKHAKELKEYDKAYYERVTKPKRKGAVANG